MPHQQCRSSQRKTQTGFARRLFGRIVRRYKDRRQRHALEALLQLDDATLDDLGLSRGELRHAAQLAHVFDATAFVERKL